MYPKLHDAIVWVLLDIAEGQATARWIAEQIHARKLYRKPMSVATLEARIRKCAKDPKRAHLFEMPTRNTIKLRIEQPNPAA